MYVLDTNTVLYWFKGQGRVADNLSMSSPGELALPAVVIYELRLGAEKSASPNRRLQQLRKLSGGVRTLAFGAMEAEHAASIRADLERRGCPIGPMDVLIAATARANNATLVTHNLDEFKRVPGLRVVDWF